MLPSSDKIFCNSSTLLFSFSSIVTFEYGLLIASSRLRIFLTFILFFKLSFIALSFCNVKTKDSDSFIRSLFLTNISANKNSSNSPSLSLNLTIAYGVPLMLFSLELTLLCQKR